MLESEGGDIHDMEYSRQDTKGSPLSSHLRPGLCTVHRPASFGFYDGCQALPDVFDVGGVIKANLGQKPSFCKQIKHVKYPGEWWHIPELNARWAVTQLL
jgi:hypothetical protein